MAENTTEVLVGGVVVAAAAGFLVYASQFAGIGAVGASSYDLGASFRSIEGIGVGSDVRLAGVKIGTVTGLDLNPETFRAEARFSINSGVQLPEDSAVVVSSEGLLGGNFIEMLPGGALETLADGDEIVDTESSVSIIQLLLRFVTGGEEE